MPIPNELRDKDYLGDGVYVGHDGWHIVLWIESGGYWPGGIALKPEVLVALDRYRKRVSAAPEAQEQDGDDGSGEPPEEPPEGKVIDLMQALKDSLREKP